MKSVVVLHVGLILTLAIADHAEVKKNTLDNNAEDMERTVPALANAGAGAGAAGANFPRPAAPSPHYGWNECYSCINCPKVYYNTTVQHCGHPPVKCVVYAQKYKHYPHEIYIRGCANERGTCDRIRKSHEENAKIMSLVFCAECIGNKCNKNGAANNFINMASAVLFLVFTPMLMKYAMS